MEDLTGRQFGPYQIVEPLGEGGMAAVYKAYQPSMDRHVALKVLPRHFSDDPHFTARFQREAKLVAQLQHPHILPVFDYGQAQGYTYIVMPFVRGGTLSGLLEGRPSPLSHVRRAVSQVGEALSYAHSRGLVHRDVKPSNVLIDEEGNCLLTDFGLARMVEASVNLTITGAVVGTPAYMSPEQGLGQKVDSRTDIYSLGVILYQMATGRVPYQAETPIALILKHVQDPLPPARALNPSIPEGVERVILKALSKTPQDRFQTAAEMVRALQAAIPDTVTTSAADTTTGMELQRRRAQAQTKTGVRGPQAMSRIALRIAIGLLLVAVVTGIAAILARSQTHPSPTATQASAHSQTSLPGLAKPSSFTATALLPTLPTRTAAPLTVTPPLTISALLGAPAPILYLPFDGDATDQSGENHSTRATGTIEFLPGIHGLAAQFDGSGEAVEVSGISMSAMPISDEMTLEFWVNMRNWQNPYPESPPLESIASYGAYFTVGVWSGSWELEASVMTGSGRDQRVEVGGGHVRPGQWHHIALVYGGSQSRVRLFLDGELVQEQIASGQIPAVDELPLVVGTWFEQNQAFAGLVDELRLYNVALGDDLVRALARPSSQARTPTLTPAPTSDTTLVGQNLLDNASFEENPAAGVPWFADARNTDLFAEWTTRRARSGQHSLLLRATTPGQAGWPGWLSAPVPIGGGYTFAFSAWAHSPDGAYAWLDIAFLDANEEHLMGYSTGCVPVGASSQPSEWEDFLTVTFTRSEVPAATHVILGLLQCLTYTEG